MYADLLLYSYVHNFVCTSASVDGFCPPSLIWQRKDQRYTKYKIMYGDTTATSEECQRRKRFIPGMRALNV